MGKKISRNSVNTLIPGLRTEPGLKRTSGKLLENLKDGRNLYVWGDAIPESWHCNREDIFS